MARNTLKLDLKGFEDLVTKFEGLGGDVQKVVTDALEKAGKTIGDDTVAAVQKNKLPAQGDYSQGETAESVVTNPKVEWSGTMAEIGVGFDYGKPGAGGFLVAGTPRMEPSKELQKIYKQKKYMRQIQDEMAEVVNKEIIKKMGG